LSFQSEPTGSIEEETVMNLSMSRSKSFRIARIGVVLAVFAGPVWAQGQKPKPSRYTVTDLGTLPGGAFSLAVSMNDRGVISGASALPDGTQHAVLWQNGLIKDIGAPGLGTTGLEAPNSEAYGVNETSEAAGGAETSSLDPNGEDFCGYGTHLTCAAFVWRHGVMTPLPTLGGNNGEAGLINSRGEVAGNAENTTLDSTCGPAADPQKFQEKPVIWRDGEIKELPTFRDDPDGWTFGINDNGQVVGASGICAPLNQDTFVYILSRHALLWDKGNAIDIGNLGGTGTFGPGNIGGEINNQGQVVGTSDLAGDSTFHGFLWTEKTGIRDLGTLPGDFASAGLGINARGEAVGVSFDAGFNPTAAFVWRDGVMTDLNILIPSDSPVYLLFAHGINSRGEIVGFGATSTGDIHAFLATPCDQNHADAERCKEEPEAAADERDETTERPKVVLSENARRLLRQYMSRHYHIGGPQ
jgi:probable HAF family extracellular repeat protein